ncbi:MAG: hypothetical protein KatS3mg015_0885 [Fimbriimonadales bacterium]|nr:MAG: hypothetical protein KatS3mg015_0885 [Fimbriimonadales bacterium]
MKKLSILMALLMVGSTVFVLGCNKSDEVENPEASAAPAEPAKEGEMKPGTGAPAEFAEPQLPPSGDGSNTGGTTSGDSTSGGTSGN